jgi:hypothetical protein
VQDGLRQGAVDLGQGSHQALDDRQDLRRMF